MNEMAWFWIMKFHWCWHNGHFFLLFMFRLLRFSHDWNVNSSWQFMYVYLRFSQYFGHFPLISFSSPIYFLRSFYFRVLGKYANVQLCFSHDMKWMANTLSDLCFVLQYFDILWVPNFIWRSACDLKWWCVGGCSETVCVL